MKNFACIIVTVLGVLLTTSCEDKKTSYPPVYQGFTISPSKPCPGDSVTITAVVDRKGSLLYNTQYNWGMTLTVLDENGYTRDTTFAVKQVIPSDGSQYKNPEVKFLIPRNAFVNGKSSPASIRFSATFSHAADGEVVGNMGGYTGDGCFGTIQSQVSTLYSSANGNGRFYIYAKQ